MRKGKEGPRALFSLIFDFWSLVFGLCFCLVPLNGQRYQTSYQRSKTKDLSSFFLVRRRTRVHKASHTISKQHINLLRFNQRGNFALAKRGVHHCLSRAISPCLVVGCAGIEFASGPSSCAGLEAANRSAFWTRHSRNFAALG